MKYNAEKETWNKSGIYSISNTIDNRTYIGSTNCFRERFRSHRKKLIKGNNASVYLQRFVSKYGIDKLVFSILEIVDDTSLLIEREDFYLQELKPEFNLMLTALRQQGQKHSKEVVNKMKEIALNSFKNGRVIWNKNKFIFSKEQVIEIRARINNGERQVDLAKEYCVTPSTINRLYKKQYNGI